MDPGRFSSFDVALRKRILHPVFIDDGDSPYSAQVWEAYHTDCSGGAVTVNLPSTAKRGQVVGVYDIEGASETHNITVGRNGNTINGVASDFIIDVNFGMAWFEWTDGDWLLNLGGVDIIGGAGRTLDICLIVDGQGAAISTGAKTWVRIPWDITLTGWKMTADQNTTTTIDLWKDTYANFPPTDADSVTNGHEPALANATKAENTDISDWSTTSISAGDFIRFNVDANNNAQLVELCITAERV